MKDPTCEQSRPAHFELRGGGVADADGGLAVVRAPQLAEVLRPRAQRPRQALRVVPDLRAQRLTHQVYRQLPPVRRRRRHQPPHVVVSIRDRHILSV